MKKVLSIVAALLLCVGTQAQIVSSRSAIVKTQKQASNTQWFLRAGLNIMNARYRFFPAAARRKASTPHRFPAGSFH